MNAVEPPRPVHDQVYRSVLDAICDGTLPGGERLTQEEIAARLSVSRQPVMQALLRLKEQGFVRDAGARGLEVAPLTADLVRDLYDLRGALDGLAAARAAERRTDADVARGRALLAAGRRSVRGGRGPLIDADVAFHRYLYGLAGNALVERTMEVFWRHLERAMVRVLRDPERQAEVWDEHDAILAAVAAGDAAGARALALAHAERAGDELRRALQGSADA